MGGKITAIYLAPEAGAPMQAVSLAELESGRGIKGDRYHVQGGTFSEKLLAKGQGDWEATLIETEAIDAFNKSVGLNIGYGNFRRNIVTQGVKLNALVGQRFRVGKVVLEGIRLCEPCTHLASLVSKSVLPALVGHGGLRARIVEGGSVSPGDSVDRLAL